MLNDPSKTTEFKYPIWVRRLLYPLLALLLVVVVGALLSSFAAEMDSLQLKALCVAAACTYVWLVLYGRPIIATLFSTFVVSEAGIEISGTGGKKQTILWDDIDHIRERPMLQTLEVWGRDGKPALIVDFFLEDYEAFRLLVMDALGLLDDEEAD